MNHQDNQGISTRTMTPSLVVCADCGVELSKQSRFCPDCGSQQFAPSPPDQPNVMPSESELAAGSDHVIDGTAALDDVATGARPSSADQDAVASRCSCGQGFGQNAQYCSDCGKPRLQNASTSFRLVARTADGQRSVHSIDGPLTIGSIESCRVRVSGDTHLSREHARIDVIDDQIILEDMMSSNGTFLRVRQPHLLKDGDEILAGSTLFRIERNTTAAQY